MASDLISLEGLPDKYADMAKSYVDYLRHQAEKEKQKAESPGKKVELAKFSFKRSKEALKDLQGDLSDAVIEERTSYL